MTEPKTDRIIEGVMVVFVLTAFTLAISLGIYGGCTSPPVVAEPATELDAKLAPVAEAMGDVKQELSNVQQTLSQIQQNQNSQATELAGKIDSVGRDVIQNVQKTMYGSSPEDAKLKAAAQKDWKGIVAKIVVLSVGIALLALFLPAIGGTPLLVLAIILIVLASLALLV